MLLQPLHSHPRVTAGGRFGFYFDDGLVYKVPLDPFSYQVRAGAAAEQPSHSGWLRSSRGRWSRRRKEGGGRHCLRVMAIVGFPRVGGAQR